MRRWKRLCTYERTILPSQKSYENNVAIIIDACRNPKAVTKSPFKLSSLEQSTRKITEIPLDVVMDRSNRTPEEQKTYDTATLPLVNFDSTEILISGMDKADEKALDANTATVSDSSANDASNGPAFMVVTAGGYGCIGAIILLIDVVLMGLSGYIYACYRVGFALPSLMKLIVLCLSAVSLTFALTAIVLVIRRLVHVGSRKEGKGKQSRRIRVVYDKKGHVRVLVELIIGALCAAAALIVVFMGM